MKKMVIAFILLFAVSLQAQKLQLENGRIYNSNSEKLAARQVRFLLADRPDLLKKYNAYQDKSIWGGILPGAGAGLLVHDLAIALTSTHSYPTAATYLGGAMTAASLPILIGRCKKLETMVEEYNRDPSTADSGSKIDELDIIANGAGARVQILF